MSSARVERALRQTFATGEPASRWVRIRHGEPLHFAIEARIYWLCAEPLELYCEALEQNGRDASRGAMRAVLFASATATTSGGRRRRNPITHGSALVAFDRSRLALAPLMSSRRSCARVGGDGESLGKRVQLRRTELHQFGGRVLDPHIGEAQAADLGYVVGCTSSDTGRRGRVGEVKHREQLTQMRGTSFVCGRSTVVVVILVLVQWHHVVVLVLVQWHHARIIAAAPLLCSEHPLLSQIEKLIQDSQVICQSGKPHAFSCVARAFFFGGHSDCCSRREQQRSPLEQLETINYKDHPAG
jgi:hypothetical protein